MRQWINLFLTEELCCLWWCCVVQLCWMHCNNNEMKARESCRQGSFNELIHRNKFMTFLRTFSLSSHCNASSTTRHEYCQTEEYSGLAGETISCFLPGRVERSDQLVEEMHLYVAVECHLTRVRIMQSKEGNQRKICRLQLRRNFFPVSACSWGCAALLHWWWLYSGASSGVFIHWLLMCCMTWLILTSSARICWGVQLTLLYDDATTASYILSQLKLNPKNYPSV